jgi:hypothetical protein
MKRLLRLRIDDREHALIRRLAAQEHLSVAAWVRQVLRGALRGASREAGDTERKLAAIRGASRHAFPTASIETMLDEIARGRGRA